VAPSDISELASRLSEREEESWPLDVYQMYFYVVWTIVPK